MSSAGVFQLWLLACCRWFHLRSLNLPRVGRTAHNKTVPSNKSTSGWFRQSSRRVVINHAEMMHCGLKNWKGKARLNIDIYDSPTVLAFTLADMKRYVQWKWEINPLVCVLLGIPKWRGGQGERDLLIWGCCRWGLPNLWEAEGTSVLVLKATWVSRVDYLQWHPFYSENFDGAHRAEKWV